MLPKKDILIFKILFSVLLLFSLQILTQGRPSDEPEPEEPEPEPEPADAKPKPVAQASKQVQSNSGVAALKNGKPKTPPKTQVKAKPKLLPPLPKHPDRDGSDPHDEPVPGLSAAPLKTVTGDELDETVQIHGSWVDGGDFSLPLLKPMDNNLNDELDATATEKIMIMKAAGDSQIISQQIKIGKGSQSSKFSGVHEAIEQRLQEHAKNGVYGKERYEIFVNDGHMTVGKDNKMQVFHYYGPIEITKVDANDEKSAQIIQLEEHIDDSAHASGNNNLRNRKLKSSKKNNLGNYIKVIVSDIHGSRRNGKKPPPKPKGKVREYKMGRGGFDRGRWASSMAIAGTTSISGDGHGSVSGANAQDANPNSRTRADATAMVWQGGSEAISKGSADSMDFHGSKPVCLRPPCTANNAQATSFAEQFQNPKSNSVPNPADPVVAADGEHVEYSSRALQPMSNKQKKKGAVGIPHSENDNMNNAKSRSAGGGGSHKGKATSPQTNSSNKAHKKESKINPSGASRSMGKSAQASRSSSSSGSAGRAKGNLPQGQQQPPKNE